MLLVALGDLSTSAPLRAQAPAGPTYAAAMATAGRGQLSEALRILDAWQPDGPVEEEQKLWARAVILRQMGRAAEALPLLEALVLRRPDVPRFRIALGEVLSARGQKERARLHLEEAYGGIETDADRNRAARLLDTLRDRGEWSGRFGLAFIPSTNAAQQTSARTVGIDGRTFVIADSARKKGARGISVQAGLDYAPRIGPATRLRFGISGNAKFYDANASDDLRLRAETALRIDLSPDMTIEGGVGYGHRWIDGDTYSRGPGLFLGFATFPDRQSRLQLAAALDDLSHDTAPGLDGVRALAVLSYSRALTPQLQMRGSLGVERANTVADSASYDSLWAGVGATYAFRGGLRVNLDVSLRRSTYEAPSRLFARTREDTHLRGAVEVTHGRLGVAGFAPVAAIEYNRRKSNISVYSYDELSARLGLTRRF